MRSIRLLTLPAAVLLWFALAWVQTASAWHEAEHALHGHATDDLACEILSGTAEQPASLVLRVVVGTYETAPDRQAVRTVSLDSEVTHAYRSRAPPL